MKAFVIELKKKVQCNVVLTITVAITGSSKTKIYKKLRLESLKFRR